MTSASMVLVLLVGLVGIMLWIIGIIALDILRDGHRADDKRQAPSEPDLHDGFEAPHAHHLRQRL